MAVAYRSSSLTGTSDSFVTSLNIPVPSGAAAGDIALCSVGRWESANPAITAPSGFTQITQVVSGNNKIALFWKRLTGADSGSYTFSWTGQQWSLGQAMLVTGVLASGDPVDAFSGLAASGTTYPGTSVNATDADFLALFAYNETSGAGTPPTNFTEVQDANNLKSNYRVLTASGTYSGSGGSMPSGVVCGVLVALKPAASGGGSQTVNAQLLASAATVGQPTVTPGAVSLAPQLLASTATVGLPSLATGAVTLAPQLLASAATVGLPNVAPGAVTVSPQLLAGAATVGQPTVSVGAATVTPETLAAGATVGQPSISVGAVTVSPQALAAGSTVGQPTVTPGAVTIAPQALAAGSTVSQPDVTSGAVTVTPQLLASTAAVGEPSTSLGPVTVAPQLVASTATVGQPTVLVSGSLAPERIESAATVGQPASRRARSPSARSSWPPPPRSGSRPSRAGSSSRR
ncbi:hypothetical protein [Pseudonocardia sp.]|uniref:hypothetical protein n=1 Tax=Pseudonocardia sp. TaxID=60912 RepID=UPI003D10F036